MSDEAEGVKASEMHAISVFLSRGLWGEACGWVVRRTPEDWGERFAGHVLGLASQAHMASLAAAEIRCVKRIIKHLAPNAPTQGSLF